MVVSPSMHNDIDVKVPTIRYIKNIPNEKQQQGPNLIIQETKIFLNGKQINDSELKSELEAHSKELEIFIKADESLSYKRVFEILELVKLAGFYKIMLVGIVK